MVLPVFEEFTKANFIFCPFIISCFVEDMYVKINGFCTIAFLLEVVYNKKAIYWRNWYDL